MNAHANPTALTVGKSGKLCGVNYRVAGRVVLGVTVQGETYYWNEFHLMDDTGQSATLVFEEGEGGPEWKLFVMFEPVEPMAVAEAARKRVGDTVSLDGKPIKITLAGQSRVYHIEGQAPEGVEVGDIANYFNADTGFEMHVASWTGAEIEFYRGIDVTVDDVASGFGLPVEGLTGGGLALESAETGRTTGSSWPVLPKVILVFVAGLIAFAAYTASKERRFGAVPVKQKTPPVRLVVRASGALGGQFYTVTGHAVIEIARVGSRYDWHEYTLDNKLLLINNLTGNASHWHLLRPAQPAASLTPTAAAALRANDPLSLDGATLTVRDLFQAPGAGMFGLLAQSGNEWAVVRWTARDIECYRGASLPEKDVVAAFK
ncbi:MAG: DUF4178 domain-containing protein [Verrucomicrobia bacterium]|nr:DUF4178 domain-containing protein [Verrucomicrobiota bacterium]